MLPTCLAPVRGTFTPGVFRPYAFTTVPSMLWLWHRSRTFGEKEEVMTNPVTWFEIAGADAAALRSFYGDLFDWKINADNPMNYGMVEAGEGGIGGGIAPSQDGSPRVTVYVQVTDLREALDKVDRLGGKVVTEPMQVPDGPTLAYFTDPAGNFIGLMKP